MAKLYKLILLLILALQSCKSVPRFAEGYDGRGVLFAPDTLYATIFNSRVLQDSLCAYLNQYNWTYLNDSIPQVFCIYVYLDQQNDTIIDFSNSIAFRLDLKELFGIYTKGETSFLGKRVIVKYRSIDSFSAINEQILQESNADDENIFTREPELLNQMAPAALKPTSRVYKLFSRDSLQLLSRYSLVPTYDNPIYTNLPINH